tara:strand:+ start:1775 stop:2074 length:300 start_codon:yes stop_codon:yes gene_type:complete
MAEVKKVSETQVIKFEELEIQKIQKFKTDFSEITARLGEVEIEITLLNSQFKHIDTIKQGLKEKYIKLRESEVELAAELRQKYGEGEFDIDSGVFTPKK